MQAVVKKRVGGTRKFGHDFTKKADKDEGVGAGVIDSQRFGELL